MSKATLKLALEALELMYACYAHPEWISHKQQEEKILAQCAATTMTLRQALAKQEQGELVAWRETHGKVIKALAGIVNVHTPDNLFDLDAIPRDPVMALVQEIKAALDKYKPPQQRTWVGLTNEEIATTADYFKDAYGFTQGVLWAEAKLKEKNT